MTLAARYGQCLAAVKRHGEALEYVPEALRTEDLCPAR
jgi:hypothetical protein